MTSNIKETPPLIIHTKDIEKPTPSEKSQSKYPRGKPCEDNGELEVLTERSNEEYSPQVRKVKQLHTTPSTKRKLEHYPSSPSKLQVQAMETDGELKNECRSECN